MNLKLYANKVYRKESVGSIQIIDNMLSKNVIYQLVMQVHVYCLVSRVAYQSRHFKGADYLGQSEPRAGAASYSDDW